MSLAIFDLDNTLLAGDSDYLWGRFLVEQGIVDGDHYEKENQRFYDEYKSGKLDIFEFLRFSLAPLAQHDMATLERLHRQFMDTVIQPLIRPEALALLKKHRDRGDFLLIITATNRFVTAPIARAFGVDAMLATDPEVIDGRYTGEVDGTPCFQHGKVERLQTWLADSDHSLDGSWFYSDSHNDLPLLKMVDHPVVVDPDPQLADHARQHNWPHLSLHLPAEHGIH